VNNMNTRFSLACVFALALLIGTSAGQWVNSSYTDSRFGQETYFCIYGSRVQGSYSEIGLIQGTVAGELMTGVFYQAGGRYVNCSTGTFSIVRAQDGNSFSGSYVCRDTGVSRPWTERYLGGDATVSDDKCGTLASTATPIGYWNTTNYAVDMCVTQDTFQASFVNKIINATGYANGEVYNSNLILPGVYAAEGNPNGVILFYVAYDNSLRYFYWDTERDYIVRPGNFNNSLLHESRTIPASAHRTFQNRADRCSRNEAVFEFGTWGNSTWTNEVEFGGLGQVMYICFIGNRLHGAYSEYGLVQGTLSGNRVTGNFYEAGGPFVECSHGTFEWVISPANNVFVGSYTCGNLTFAWNSTKLGGAATTSPDACAVLDRETGGTLGGSWIGYNTINAFEWDICENGAGYNSSYQIGTIPINGYALGASYEGGIIGAGVFSQENVPIGVQIVFRTFESKLETFFWVTGGNLRPNITDYRNSTRHSNPRLTYRRPTTLSACLRNELVFDAGSWSNSTWTDTTHDGTNLKLCFIGNKGYGAYSNLGILEGTVRNATFSGNFHQAGGGKVECSSGSFVLNIRADGRRFSGTYVCRGSNFIYTWQESLTGNNASVNADTCAVTGSGRINGTWSTGVVTRSICQSSARQGYVSSYRSAFAPSNLGYSFGLIQETNEILSGNFIETFYPHGIELIWLTYDNNIGVFSLRTDSNYVPQLRNGQTYFYNKYALNGTATAAQCNANQALAGPVPALGWSDSSWRESRYGGNMYLCFVNNQLQGSYSDVGLLQGTRNNNVITGNFFQGGGSQAECSYGTFTLTLSAEGQRFNGTYTCTRGGSFAWNGVYLAGSVSVNDDVCAVVASSGTTQASWTDGVSDLDICIDSSKNTYRNSYDFERVDGYEVGTSYQSGRIISGYFKDEIGGVGVALSWRTNTGALRRFAYATSDDYVLDPATGFYYGTRFASIGPATTQECAKNSYLIQQVGSSWTNSTFTSYSAPGKNNGLLYLCVIGNRGHGTYSELGLLQGTVSGESFVGDFYQAGGSRLTCTTGTFSLTMDPNGFGFYGVYQCQDSGQQFRWNETLVLASADPSTCAILPTFRDTVAGVWAGTDANIKLDVCLTAPASYVSSGDLVLPANSRQVQTYSVGSSYESGRIIAGINSQTTAPYGIGIQWVDYEDRLGSFYWRTDASYAIDRRQIGSSNIHSFYYLTRSFDSTASIETCNRHNSLINTYGQWSNSTFSDSRIAGGFIHFCFVGRELHGSYSEVGLLQGTLATNGSSISGRFFEAGGERNPCAVGDFFIQIDGTNTAFTGYYTCANSAIRRDWSGQLTGNSTTVDDAKCGVVGNNGDIAATWASVNFPVTISNCLSGSDSVFSATTAPPAEINYAYGIGKAFQTGRIISSYVRSSNTPYGISLSWVDPQGQLNTFNWFTDSNYTYSLNQIGNINVHQYFVSRISGVASSSECNANEEISRTGPPPPVVIPGSSSVSSASSVTVFFALFALVAFLL